MAWEFTYQATEYFATMYQAMMKQALLQKIYPYGNPDVKGVGDKVASGELYDSIQAYVEVGSDGQPVIIIEYLDYYNYVNTGSRPNTKKDPVQSLINWIKIRGIRTDRQFEINSLAYSINAARAKKDKHKLPLDVLRAWIEKKGIRMDEERKTLSLAFAIQQNIFRYGIRPTNIYDVGLNNFEDQIDNPPPNLERELERVYQAMEEDINILIENILTKEIPTK